MTKPDEGMNAMKNRIVSAVLMLAMLFSPCLAFAMEASAPLSPFLIERDKQQDQEIPAAYTWQTGVSTVYVPVKRYQRTGLGWSEPQTYYPAVGHVDYKFWHDLDAETETWQGGFWINSTYPRPYAMTGGQAELLEPVFAKVSDPMGTFESSAIDEGFTISISGGSFSVTYNSSLYYDTDGSLHHVERTTMMRSFNWSYTGP